MKAKGQGMKDKVPFIQSLYLPINLVITPYPLYFTL